VTDSIALGEKLLSLLKESARTTTYKPALEDFLFGRDRVALERVAEGLLDLQRGRCFYCNTNIGSQREIDHFVPWSYSGDDGLDNLVAACHRCNNSKRATLAGPDHLGALLRRNHQWDGDLAALAAEWRWPRDHPRSLRITRAAYLHAPDERPLWAHRHRRHLRDARAAPHRADRAAALAAARQR
jgi:hypothetical protein